MMQGLYISASGMQATQLQQTVLSNNLANSMTAGFKVDRVQVESLPAARANRGPARGPDAAVLSDLSKLGGVFARGTVTEMTAGPLETSGEPLDIALSTGPVSDGFLAVEGPGKAVRWTRDGRLAIDAGGQLVSRAGGLAILNEAGQPIKIDTANGPINIDDSGRIRQGESEVARLKLATFARPQSLVKQGGGLFAAGRDAAAGSFRGQVVQGSIEQSAVQPTTALTQMIEVQRAYEANANMIRYQDQILSRAVNDIGRVG